MKKIILIISLLFLFGCGEDSVTISNEEYNKLKGITQSYPKYLGEFTTVSGSSMSGASISAIVIDSCEYIGMVRYSNADKLAHKGNCIFCKKRRDKENKLIINEVVKRLQSSN